MNDLCLLIKPALHTCPVCGIETVQFKMVQLVPLPGGVVFNIDPGRANQIHTINHWKCEQLCELNLSIKMLLTEL